MTTLTKTIRVHSVLTLCVSTYLCRSPYFKIYAKNVYRNQVTDSDLYDLPSVANSN